MCDDHVCDGHDIVYCVAEVFTVGVISGKLPEAVVTLGFIVLERLCQCWVARVFIE